MYLLEKLTLLKRETAILTHPLYSSGFRLTNASIKLTAAVATPFKKKQEPIHINIF